MSIGPPVAHLVPLCKLEKRPSLRTLNFHLTNRHNTMREQALDCYLLENCCNKHAPLSGEGHPDVPHDCMGQTCLRCLRIVQNRKLS